MENSKDQLIEKAKLFQDEFNKTHHKAWNRSRHGIAVVMSEFILSLERQTEEQESKPVYDEAYLNECIAKAKPRLSKIKDIDKEMNEIKGIEEQCSADNIKDLLREYGCYGIDHNENANNKLIEALIKLFNQL